MKSLHKVIKRVLRYEIGVFLKNSDFEYLYGSISYLFGYEKNRCFFLMSLLSEPFASYGASAVARTSDRGRVAET
jgi:hypothetical protein